MLDILKSIEGISYMVVEYARDSLKNNNKIQENDVKLLTVEL